MPNICDFEMRIKGKKESIDEFIRVSHDLSMPRHFWRVFDHVIYDSTPCDDGDTIVSTSGSCAWSVYVCMFLGPLTYGETGDPSSTSLQLESERLDLDIEVYSCEPGMGFEEHYHYTSGQLIFEGEYDVEFVCFDEDDSELGDGSVDEKFSEWCKKHSGELGMYPDIDLDDVLGNCGFYAGGFRNSANQWTFALDS